MTAFRHGVRRYSEEKVVLVGRRKGCAVEVMIGQQKRPLEHAASTQPVKYQKIFDQTFGEAGAKTTSQLDVLKEPSDDSNFRKFVDGAAQEDTSSLPTPSHFDLVTASKRVLAVDVTEHLCRDKDLNVTDLVISSTHSNGPISSAGHVDVQMLSGSASLLSRKVLNLPENASDLLGSTQIEKGKSSRNVEEVFTSAANPVAGIDQTGNPVVPVDTAGLQHDVHLADVEVSHHTGSEQEQGGALTDETATDSDIFLEALQKSLEARRPKGPRPLPVLIGEKVVDLFSLHSQVKSAGGYQVVTSQGLWGSISESLGLGSYSGPGVKLVYFKYLKALERGSVESCPANNVIIGGSRLQIPGNENSLGLGSVEKKPHSLSEHFADNEPAYGGLQNKELNGETLYIQRETEQDKLSVEETVGRASSKRDRDVGAGHEDQEGKGSACTREAKRTHSDAFLLGNRELAQEWEGASVVESVPLQGQTDDHQGSLSLYENCSRKAVNDVGTSNTHERLPAQALEHDPFFNMLLWIKRIAVDPGNKRMGQGPRGTGQNEAWVKQCAAHAEKVRELLWSRRDELQTKQLHGSSQYYEELPRPDQQILEKLKATRDHKILERLRATRERMQHYGLQTSPTGPRSVNDPTYVQKVPSSSSNHQQFNRTSHRVPRQISYPPSYSEVLHVQNVYSERPPRKRIPIGPDFQAEVPLWKGTNLNPVAVNHQKRAGQPGDETQSSDEEEDDSSTWLGKQVWPPSGNERTYSAEKIGQGRPSSCSCVEPQSVDCVRFHVQEGKERLKRQLGQAFYIWKFDQMGECVANLWTKEEEQTFKALVKLNPPSLDKHFWDQLPVAFPGKKMKELVSYYFNVFVLRRRAMQNRLGSKTIDSDDDETELPEDSEDSDEYESGDDVENEVDDEGSDFEDEIEKQDEVCEDDSVHKFMGTEVFAEFQGRSLYKPKKVGSSCAKQEPDIHMSLTSISLGDVENQSFQHSRREERDVTLHITHVNPNWSVEQERFEKHPEEHITTVGEDDLQEVKRWEDPHWGDEGDHEDLLQDPCSKNISSCKNERPILSLEKDSGVHCKESIGIEHHPPIVPCEGGVWDGTIELAPRKESDKLLSTKGMIEELFGGEIQVQLESS